MKKVNRWTQEENKILFEHINDFKNKKWKNISRILKEKGFQRSYADCRERYINYVDPNIDKQSAMTDQELQIFYKKYQEYGPKWCLIKKFLPNRTQIRLKNLFYGNIRLLLKKLYKYFTKSTAAFINQLNTDDLQDIFDGIEEFQNFKFLKKDFRKLNFKVNQIGCQKIFKSKEKIYFQLLNSILLFKTNIKPIQHNTFFKEQKQKQKRRSNQQLEQKIFLEDSSQSKEKKSHEKECFKKETDYDQGLKIFTAYNKQEQNKKLLQKAEKQSTQFEKCADNKWNFFVPQFPQQQMRYQNIPNLIPPNWIYNLFQLLYQQQYMMGTVNQWNFFLAKSTQTICTEPNNFDQRLEQGNQKN